jgi:hypothetical protein
LFPGQAGVHPRLRTGLSIRRGEIQDPILVHKFIAVIEFHALDGGQKAVVSFDAVRPDQQKQVRGLILAGTRGLDQLALAVDLAFNLC